MSDGTVRCWGNNQLGQLGDGSLTSSFAAVAVSGITDAIQVNAGTTHACAVLSDGSIRCWGDDMNSKLGDDRYHQLCGAGDCSPLPVEVKDIRLAKEVFAGRGHTCALLRGGTVRCWGGNMNGALGNSKLGTSGVLIETPVRVSGIHNAIQLTGGEHTCALLRGGIVRCWGNNRLGALGNGKTEASSRPVRVSGIHAAISIGYVCALLRGGTVRCWGPDASGYKAQRATPLRGVTQARGVSGYLGGGCALLRGGRVKCWGYNMQGQVGTGNSSQSEPPTQVPGITDATAIAWGGYTNCALLRRGSTLCWGHNSDGQLGVSPDSSKVGPVSVAGL